MSVKRSKLFEKGTSTRLNTIADVRDFYTDTEGYKNYRNEKGQFVKGVTPWHKGKKGVYSKEVLEAMSKGHTGKKLSEEHKRKISEANIRIGNTPPHAKAEDHYNWQGGITPINKKIRNSLEYKLWRTAVFERDEYTCIWCGNRSGKGNSVVLQADHIKPFAFHPELRFAIDNGRTLCVDCHKQTDTYKGRAQRSKKLEDARSWMSYGVREGYYDIEQFEGMTPDQIIKFSESEQDRSDMAYEAQREDLQREEDDLIYNS